jgi:DnaK suppressor protein
MRFSAQPTRPSLSQVFLKIGNVHTALTIIAAKFDVFAERQTEVEMNDELTAAQIGTLRLSLEALLVSLPIQIGRASEGGRPVELDQQSVGRLSRIDAIAQQSVNKAGLARLRLRLSKVSGALRRIELDEYGYCLRCEEPVCYERLCVAPEVTACLTCQERAERS